MSKDVPKILYKKMRFMPIKIIFQVLLDMQHFNSLGFSYITESNCSIKALLPNIKQRLIDQCTQEQSSKIYSTTITLKTSPVIGIFFTFIFYVTSFTYSTNYITGV
jgi:hypothetical protein